VPERHQLEEDHAERKHIRAHRSLFSAALLRRRVINRIERRAERRGFLHRAFEDATDAKVDDFHRRDRAQTQHHNISGFQASMQNASRMSDSNRATELLEERNPFCGSESTRFTGSNAQLTFECSTGHIFGDEIRLTQMIVTLEIMKLREVWVRQLQKLFRVARQLGERTGDGEARMDEFDRHRSVVVAQIPRRPNRSAGPGAQLLVEQENAVEHDPRSRRGVRRIVECCPPAT
jgi:hypothetical protein